MSDYTKHRNATLLKVAAVFVVGFIVAPYVLTAIGGVIGVVFVIGAVWLIVHLSGGKKSV